MVIRILQNKVYTGCLEHNKKQGEEIVVANTHEAIVDAEQFYNVQRNIAKGTTGSVIDRLLADYEGSLYCGVCGKNLEKKYVGNMCTMVVWIV